MRDKRNPLLLTLAVIFVFSPVASAEDAPERKETVASSGVYVGEAVCRGCHTRIHENVTRRSREDDCTGCHTTGFDPMGAPLKTPPPLQASDGPTRVVVAHIPIDCENCHGPGAAHARNPLPGTILNPARINDIETRRMLCVRCHSGPSKRP